MIYRHNAYFFIYVMRLPTALRHQWYESETA